MTVVTSRTVDLTADAAPTGSRRLSGYLATPDGDGPWPGVVVVHEAFGVDDVMRRHTERVAAMGHLALMPDLFSDGGARRCLVTTFRALRAGEGKAFDDLEAARRRLLADPRCNGKIGVVGFCMGGGFALMLAGRGYAAVAPNYGLEPPDLDAALEGSCPVVASYGAKDRQLRDVPAKIVSALDRQGVAHDVKLYPRAGHSFLNDAWNGPRLLRPLLRAAGAGPEPVSAADAWDRIERFFALHLGGAAR
jgi:carboxymethylenebutenolidase